MGAHKHRAPAGGTGAEGEATPGTLLAGARHQPCRTWRIDIPPGTDLLTANQRMHYMTRAVLVRDLRAVACWLARAQKIPRIERAHIFGEVLARDLRRRDPGNWAPTAKACVDGLVDAGVLADDDATRVIGPDMRLTVSPARASHVAAMRLHIYEITEERTPDGADRRFVA